jgi:hypothetical protein
MLLFPHLRQFNDTDDEAVAYAELTDIYGERESEIKDFDKALDYYEACTFLSPRRFRSGQRPWH